MSAAPHLAIDAMGGDVGPSLAVAAVELALARDAALRFTLHGQ